MDPQCFAWQVIPQLAFRQRSSLLCDCVTWETALHMGLSSKLHPLQMCLVSRDLPHSSLCRVCVSTLQKGELYLNKYAVSHCFGKMA